MEECQENSFLIIEKAELVINSLIHIQTIDQYCSLLDEMHNLNQELENFTQQVISSNMLKDIILELIDIESSIEQDMLLKDIPDKSAIEEELLHLIELLQEHIEKSQYVYLRELLDHVFESSKFNEKYEFIGEYERTNISQIIRVQRREDRKECCAKLMSKVITSPRSFRNEVNIMKIFSEKGISVKLLEYFESYEYYFIIMPLYKDGDLLSYLYYHGSLDLKAAKSILQQLASHVYIMHQSGYIHGDIKPENIIIASNDNSNPGDVEIFLCDFGFSSQIDGDNPLENIYRYTLEYAAPEVIGENKYYKQSDIWSIGITYYYMLFQTIPYDISDSVFGLQRNNIIRYKIMNREILDMFSIEGDAYLLAKSDFDSLTEPIYSNRTDLARFIDNDEILLSEDFSDSF